MATVGGDSGDDFRFPSADKDYPATVQPFLLKPTLTGPSDYAVQTVVDKFLASYYVTVGLVDAEVEVSATAGTVAEDDLLYTGTVSGVEWEYSEGSTSGAASTYYLAGDEDLGNGIVLLMKNLDQNRSYLYKENDDIVGLALPAYSDYTICFAGSSVYSISGDWDAVNHTIGPELWVNGSVPLSYSVAP